MIEIKDNRSECFGKWYEADITKMRNYGGGNKKYMKAYVGDKEKRYPRMIVGIYKPSVNNGFSLFVTVKKGSGYHWETPMFVPMELLNDVSELMEKFVKESKGN